MGTAAGMLDAMRALIGTGEQPPGSNHNRLTEWYASLHGGEYDPCPWCDITVAYAAEQSGNVEATMGHHAWTVEHARAFRDAGRWHLGTAGARPGDVVFFDWGGTRSIASIDHVGVVEAVYSDGTLGTIEGNTDDRCMRRRRGPGVIAGYGRPAYDGAPAPVVDDGVLRRGSSGDRVRDLQAALNAAILAGLVEDGDYGPQTEAATRTFQGRAGVTADGEAGPVTMAALARWTAPLAVDGDMGTLTVAALQRACCRHGYWCAVDGDLGPATKAAVQRVLGVKPDGVWGPITVRTLQAKVGATLDGQLGPDTVSHLQVALNLGAF